MPLGVGEKRRRDDRRDPIAEVGNCKNGFRGKVEKVGVRSSVCLPSHLTVTAAYFWRSSQASFRPKTLKVFDKALAAFVSRHGFARGIFDFSSVQANAVPQSFLVWRACSADVGSPASFYNRPFRLRDRPLFQCRRSHRQSQVLARQPWVSARLAELKASIPATDRSGTRRRTDLRFVQGVHICSW